MKGGRLAILGLAVITALAITLPQAAAARGGGKTKSTGVRFGAPVKVTPDLGYGYEPAAVVDDFGNIFATAHKENWQLVLAPDTDSPTFTRSMSWDWVSVDDGQTWTDIPGLTPASLEQHEFGDEGDMAIDDVNHLYFVDTSVTDVSITRWTTSGRGLGGISLDYTDPSRRSAGRRPALGDGPRGQHGPVLRKRRRQGHLFELPGRLHRRLRPRSLHGLSVV
jgi:hypothetical protein